ncbi:MAG TPA: selenium cofactor biosynthesis protein YqeC [Anaerolineales bacterium]|nr:selenium cofactor biosynthesis protein YqeC [Anaerolineales bacterium]
MDITLAKALRSESSSPCIAFIGAGGKTTAMFQLARQLPAPVIVTATSHLGTWQVPLADKHIIADAPGPLEEIERGIQGAMLVTGPIDGDRTTPINDALLDWLHQFCRYHSIPLLIEADGARQKPLKAWAEHEPPIPSFVEQVIQIVGLTGVGTFLDDEHVQRPELFSSLSQLTIGEPITPDALIRVLTHPEGGLKNIPVGARKVALLNQADTPALQGIAHGMARSLLLPYHSVIIGSLEQEAIFAVHESIAGIILAAGESTRFGEPKQLLDWRGQPFVRAVAKNALDAGLWPVIVITGAYAEGVSAAVKDLDVKIVFNDDWKSGQASSIKAGIRLLSQPPPPLSGHLPQIQNQKQYRQSKVPSAGFGGRPAEGVGGEGVGGAIFLLADQPHVTASVMKALVEKHAQGLYPIVAPMVLDRRANPVLFDHSTFSDLLTLEGDVGGRAIFHNYRVEYLPWHDDGLLLDVDTPEQYQRLISNDAI